MASNLFLSLLKRVELHTARRRGGSAVVNGRMDGREIERDPVVHPKRSYHARNSTYLLHAEQRDTRDARAYPPPTIDNVMHGRVFRLFSKCRRCQVKVNIASKGSLPPPAPLYHEH